MKKRHFIPLIMTMSALIAGCVSIPIEANASDKPKVAHAGLVTPGTSVSTLGYLESFSGDLQSKLVSQAKKLSPQHYELSHQTLSDIRQGQSKSVALYVDHESVLKRQIGNVHQVVIDVFAMAIVFDFHRKEKSITAMIPVRTIPCIYSESRPISEREIARWVKDYYLVAQCEDGESLMQAYLNTIKTLNISSKFAGEIGVRDVSLANAAKEKLPTSWFSSDAKAQKYLGNLLVRHLGVEASISMIPYQSGGMLNQMSLQFTGQSDSVLLSLPEPDYVVDAHLQKLAYKQTEKSSLGEAGIHAARMEIALAEPFFEDDDPLFKKSLVHGVGTKIAASQKDFDHAGSYLVAINGLVREFSKNMASPDKEWKAMQRFSKSEQSQLKELSDIVEEINF